MLSTVKVKVALLMECLLFVPRPKFCFKTIKTKNFCKNIFFYFKMTKCCVVGCKNDGIHTFPKDPAIRKKWIAAVRIKKFVPTKYSRLCRDHFNENDYEPICITTGLAPVHKFLKKNAVPSRFWWNQKVQKPAKKSDKARAERYVRRCAHKNIPEQPIPIQDRDPCTATLQDPLEIYDQSEQSS